MSYASRNSQKAREWAERRRSLLESAKKRKEDRKRLLLQNAQNTMLTPSKTHNSYGKNNYYNDQPQKHNQYARKNNYDQQKPPRNAYNHRTNYNGGKRRPPSRSEIEQARNSLQLLKTQFNNDSDDSDYEDTYQQQSYQQVEQKRSQQQYGYQQSKRADNYHFQDRTQYQPIQQQKRQPQVGTQDLYTDVNSNYRRKFKPVFNNNYDKEEKTRYQTRTPVTNYSNNEQNSYQQKPRKQSYKSQRQKQDKRPAWNNDFNELGNNQEEQEELIDDGFKDFGYQPKKKQQKRRQEKKQDYFGSYNDDDDLSYQPKKKQTQPRRRKQQRNQYDSNKYDSNKYSKNNEDYDSYSKKQYKYNSSKYKPKSKVKTDAYQQKLRTSGQMQYKQHQSVEKVDDGEERGLDIGANDFNEILKAEEQAGPQRLRRCSMGCGRKFAVEKIKKHEKICRKVNKKPRKIFNAAAQRLDNEALQHQRSNKYQNSKKGRNSRPLKKAAKWKQQSLSLRAAMKAGRGVKVSKKEETALNNMQNQETQIPCPHCGRSFNENAAKRHLPFCAKKHQYPQQNRRKPRRRHY